MAKPTPITEFELLASFDAVRTVLSEPRFAGHRTRPLAFWATPRDRRLPLAFMGRSLGELLATPFEDLYGTPGVGRKKIRSLIDLLLRAVESPPQSNGLARGPETITAGAMPPVEDVGGLSDATWAEWRGLIIRNGLSQEPLGRFATTLQTLPRGIWTTPLAAYLELTLAEMRSMKTYGEKRMTAVLDVFASLAAILSAAAAQPHLAVRLASKAAWEVECWIQSALERDGSPGFQELDEHLIQPLIGQLKVDAGEQVSRLAQRWLALDDTTSGVRRVAGELDLTRARVYQLIDGVHVVLQVRWPGGPASVQALRRHVWACSTEARVRQYLDKATSLFFPAAAVGKPQYVRREIDQDESATAQGEQPSTDEESI